MSDYIEDKGSEIQVTDNAWSSSEQMSYLRRTAQLITKGGDMIPAAFRGDQNLPQAMMCADLAIKIGVSPVTLAQNMHFVKGKVGYSGKILIMLLNTHPKYKGGLKYDEWEDDRLGSCCLAWTLDRETGEKVKGVIVSMAMAKAEGWMSNKKWQSMPQLMLRYRAASFFASTNCPEKVAGLMSIDEIESIENRKSSGANKTKIKLSEKIINGDNS